ncbi:MAG TPA: C40 family peptidase [Acidimicrobiales bacterium]|nr:C40 family peptidase [Acidimicrobiales bacterium]
MSPVADRAPHRVRRRVSRGLVASVVCGLLAPLVIASPASADKISDTRKQAARMAAHLDDLQEHADNLSEDYADAVYQLHELDGQVAQAQAQMDAADAALGQTRDRLRGYAVSAYVHVEQSSDLLVFLGSTPEDADARIGYADIAVGKDRSLADTFRSASEDAAAARSDLMAQRERQAELQAKVQAAKKAAEKAVAQQTTALAGVRGQLAVLVRQEQARLAAEAAKQARARQQQSRTGRTSTAGRNVPAPSAGVGGAIAAARSQLGVPYRWAASSPGSGFDCSGLTSWAWARAGKSLPHSSRAQYASLPHVPLDQLQPGDLVFFGGHSVNHVGIYIGGGMMIHAPHTGATVEVATIYRRGLIGAARP